MSEHPCAWCGRGFPTTAVVEAAREVWATVPASYEEKDTMPHAAALNRLGAALAALRAAEPEGTQG